MESCIRAGDVIERIRALAKKGPVLKDNLDINETILEVTALVRGEMANKGVSVRTHLAKGLPIMVGDLSSCKVLLNNLLVNAAEP